MMQVTFRCGHKGTVSETAAAAPICPTCGETQVTHVVARAPRFTGACSGPYAETRHVESAIVNVAPGGPLRLKVQE